MFNRRNFITSTGVGAAALFTLHPKISLASGGVDVRAELARLEAATGGRLGVCLLDSATGQCQGHRLDERFLMLSSFKTLASALVLQRVDRGAESLSRRIPVRKSDMLEWAPVTEKHVGGEMTLAQLCEATITTSDNPAANLILASYGGPASLTKFLRGLGDKVTRSDRTEPQLNVPNKGEPMDTTTPRAMAETLQKLLMGTVLSPTSRQQLRQWLMANTTGGKRLRAGLPKDWPVGEKTGTNRFGANDAGFVEPPGRAPWLVAAYVEAEAAAPALRESTLAEVGALLARLNS